MRRVVLGLLCVAAALVGGCALFDSGILYEETWSDTATTAWTLGDSEYATKTIEGGRYNVLVKQNTTMMYWNNQEGPFGDAQIDLDVKHEAGTENLSAGGMVFRCTDVQNTYIFEVSAFGTFHVAKWVGNVWTAVVAWTASDAVNKGIAQNHLTVLADGTSLTFLINDTEVAEVTDSSFSSGFVGVAVTAFSEDVDVEESFDNLVVREL
jgi:hypothetical protein